MATRQIWRYPAGVRTGRDLTGYDVEASNGSIGSIDEATDDVEEYWVIVDTGPWIFGKRVLLPAGVIKRIDHDDQRVFVDRSRDEIKQAPEYNVATGASDPYRQRVGSYYSAPRTGGREARSEAASSSGRTQQSRRSGSRSDTRRSRSAGRARRSDEPTKQELYDEAKRLGIPGRSRMNKSELKRALSRSRGRSSQTGQGRQRGSESRQKANPVEVQAFLDGVSYPTRKGDLVREAERSGASKKVRATLERLPEERFESPTEVSEAVGKVG
jgi:uncharacterized protein DUF2795